MPRAAGRSQQGRPTLPKKRNTKHLQNRTTQTSNLEPVESRWNEHGSPDSWPYVLNGYLRIPVVQSQECE